MIRHALISSLVLVPVASASVWVVDDTPGPGVDFATIGAAIAASAPGDVIRVRPGNYPGFTLSIGVTILADAGANAVYSPTMVSVMAVPAGQRAVISGLYLYSLNVTACAGPVLVERVSGTDYGTLLTAGNSSDVRVRDCTIPVEASASRVEVTGSALRGRRGADGCQSTDCQGPGYNVNGSPGGPGVLARDGAIVHVGSTTVEGGRGGDGGGLTVGCPNGFGGQGGVAIRALSGGVVHVTGNGLPSLIGGTGGWGETFGSCGPAPDGAMGGAIDASGGGTVLHSGVIVIGQVAGPVTQVTPVDPCLVTVGNGTAGTQLTFRVFGVPGDNARLRLGRQLVVEDLPQVFEDRLTIPLRSYQLGVLPASGQLSFSINVPTTLPPGFVLVAQGSTTSAAGDTWLTHSAPFAVR